MNFFQEQDRARRNTVLLFVLIALAMLSLAVMSVIALLLTAYFLSSGYIEHSFFGFVRQFEPSHLGFLTLGILIAIVGGSLRSLTRLSSDGAAIAQALGGELIPGNTRILAERRLLNLVEEMAVASGNPVPSKRGRPDGSATPRASRT